MKKLETIFDKLTQTAVARHDISVQGSPEELAEKCGIQDINAEEVQKCVNAPTRELFLSDDWGWILGFSFALPLVVCLILAIFVIGDIQSTHDNYLYGALGAVVGIILGGSLATLVKRFHDKKIRELEIKGGYVLWVTVNIEDDLKKVIKILKTCKASSIRIVN